MTSLSTNLIANCIVSITNLSACEICSNSIYFDFCPFFLIHCIYSIHKCLRPKNTFGSCPKGFPRVDEIMRVYLCMNVCFLTFLYNSIDCFHSSESILLGCESYFNTCYVLNAKQRNKVDVCDIRDLFEVHGKLISTWKTTINSCKNARKT